MLDAESLVDYLLTGDLPGVDVAAENSPDMTFPAVRYSVDVDGQHANYVGLWGVSLTVSIIGPAVWPLPATVYDRVRAWVNRDTPYGHVVSVADVSAPSRSPDADAESKTAQQYDGVFTLLVRA